MTDEGRRTKADLARYIAEHGIAAELVTPPHETPSVAQAAAAMGCAPEQIIKSLVFLISGQPYLVIANGDAPISYRRLAAHFGISRKRIRMATPEEVLALTGYPAGGVPPFGWRTSLPVLMDPGVLTQDIVYGGGGDERTLVRIAPAELRRVTRPVLVTVTDEVVAATKPLRETSTC
ncbi:MAG: YbaK/EbsC family protein [Anaerolineae bacterium]|nr:YbaK/EbsC family protein [Anaerolineae bacterium]MDW8098457.1 YbaK/EbsC family protein [Anaerolineae bacterium]